MHNTNTLSVSVCVIRKSLYIPMQIYHNINQSLSIRHGLKLCSSCGGDGATSAADPGSARCFCAALQHSRLYPAESVTAPNKSLPISLSSVRGSGAALSRPGWEVNKWGFEKTSASQTGELQVSSPQGLTSPTAKQNTARVSQLQRQSKGRCNFQSYLHSQKRPPSFSKCQE